MKLDSKSLTIKQRFNTVTLTCTNMKTVEKKESEYFFLINNIFQSKINFVS